MPEFSFDDVIDRRHTGSIKWDRYAHTEILPLWVADMDFASPPAVLDALQRRIRHGVFGYTKATESLYDTVLQYLRDRHQTTVDASWIVWLPGIVPALSMSCGCAGVPGDRVLTCSPVYPPFLHVHRDSARQLDVVPMLVADDGRYVLDWESLERAVTPATKVFLFCNPHNPVGRVFSRDEVAAVAAFCDRHHLIWCADEIHCDLILDESRTPHTSALSFDHGVRDRTILLMAASKTYNIAGLACAFAIIPDPALRRAFLRAAGKRLAEISPLSFVATEAAYRAGEPWRQELLNVLRSHRDFLDGTIRAHLPQIAMTPLEATYLAWLDVRGLPLDSPHHFFEEHGLGFSNGTDFGTPGFMRMNFGCPRATLAQAVARLQQAVAATARDAPVS